MFDITPEWQNQSSRWGHTIHSMCSYMAMFPPRLPHYFIERFTKPGDIVIDPFCGRGTTPVQACFTNRFGIGNDLSPLAYILTKAKVDPPNKNELVRRIENLEDDFTPKKIDNITGKIRMLYSKKTLQQLVYLKENLNLGMKVDTFIMSVVLGGMHGDSPLPNYMSIPMPNTFSMSPKYVKKYIIKHNLKPPSHDAFTVIRHRIKRLYSKGIPGLKGKAFNEDIRKLKRKLNGIKANLILTSPPYLKVIKYGKFNWIRLWMLDIESKELDGKLDGTHSLPKYLDFMEDSLKAMYNFLEEDGVCILVIGDVFGCRGIGKGKTINLAETVWDNLKDKVDFELISIIDDEYRKDNKVSRIWGKTKGVATEKDRLLILCKDKTRVLPYKYNYEVDWKCNYPDRFSQKISCTA